MFRSLLSTLEELTLLVLPHGGQRTARRNAWRAATDLHVTSGYRWAEGVGPGSPVGSVGSAGPVISIGSAAVRPAFAAARPRRPVAAHR
ncbi:MULTISPECIES: hypothetical protein [unclassified Pseudofrankia]|uniref:hypothetical protein n=1 Tax=unclassified Pseudofrankia TaxID=2994372 RepID=UPI0008DAE934|nr:MULTISPECIES: hypothetical protein [unclassified Pseudofrankia]MDT3446793.1 hypothetical protein [Pseudofrankia sp. BMG5.37]OHV65949.1 hypothetical protein BCD48_35965 [Pseudofrankia sp. BMG5.36]